jgi:hypothetical protein
MCVQLEKRLAAAKEIAVLVIFESQRSITTTITTAPSPSKPWKGGRVEGLEGWRGSFSDPEELLSHRFTPTRVTQKKDHSLLLSKGAKVQGRRCCNVTSLGAVVPWCRGAMIKTRNNHSSNLFVVLR